MHLIGCTFFLIYMYHFYFYVPFFSIKLGVVAPKLNIVWKSYALPVHVQASFAQ